MPLETLTHRSHVHRRPNGSLFSHEHRGGANGRSSHGHHRATFVRDVRTCPGCFGPIAMVREGTDDRGRWEVWRCAQDCRGIPLAAMGRDWQTVGGERLGPSEIVLRDRDYDKAALARAKAFR